MLWVTIVLSNLLEGLMENWYLKISRKELNLKIRSMIWLLNQVFNPIVICISIYYVFYVAFRLPALMLTIWLVPAAHIHAHITMLNLIIQEWLINLCSWRHVCFTWTMIYALTCNSPCCFQGDFKVQEDKKHRAKYASLSNSEEKLQFFSARQIACRLLGSRGYLCQKVHSWLNFTCIVSLQV